MITTISMGTRRGQVHQAHGLPITTLLRSSTNLDWGDKFHFALRMKGESFYRSLERHEEFISDKPFEKPGPKKGGKVLDCGCGIGGLIAPSRSTV